MVQQQPASIAHELAVLTQPFGWIPSHTPVGTHLDLDHAEDLGLVDQVVQDSEKQVFGNDFLSIASRNVAQEVGLRDQLEEILRKEARMKEEEEQEGEEEGEGEEDDNGGSSNCCSNISIDLDHEPFSMDESSDDDDEEEEGGERIKQPTLCSYPQSIAALTNGVSVTPTTIRADVSGWPFGDVLGVANQPRSLREHYAIYVPMENHNTPPTSAYRQHRLRPRPARRLPYSTLANGKATTALAPPFSLVNATPFLQDRNVILRERMAAFRAKRCATVSTGTGRYRTRAVEQARLDAERTRHAYKEASSVIRRVRPFCPTVVDSNGFSNGPYCTPVRTRYKGLCFANTGHTPLPSSSATHNRGAAPTSSRRIHALLGPINFVRMKNGRHPVVAIRNSSAKPRCVGIDEEGFNLLRDAIHLATLRIRYLQKLRRNVNAPGHPLPTLVDQDDIDFVPEYVAVFKDKAWGKANPPLELDTPRLFEFWPGSLPGRKPPALNEVSFHYHVEV